MSAFGYGDNGAAGLAEESEAAVALSPLTTRPRTELGDSAPTEAAAIAPARPRRVDVLGCQIDHVDMEQAIAICEDAIRSRRPVQHVAINAAKLIALRSDDELRRAIEGCELITADGQPIVWASRLLGDGLPDRVTGIDLMFRILQLADDRGLRIYVLGGRATVLERAVRRIRARYPHLAIVGHHHGYYDGTQEAAIAQTIATVAPDVLFVAMSSPGKEHFLARHRDTMAVPVVMGVGGAIDVVAGVRRRAPIPLQRLGLEWLFRLIQEPRRLLKRYLSTNVRFMVLLIREAFNRCISRSDRPGHLLSASGRLVRYVFVRLTS